jgi:hypothetical protein
VHCWQTKQTSRSPSSALAWISVEPQARTRNFCKLMATDTDSNREFNDEQYRPEPAQDQHRHFERADETSR